MTARTRRERLKDELTSEIKTVGRRILAEHGIAAVTVTAIAREVKVTPAALYRHFDGLNDLICKMADDIVDDLVVELDASGADERRDDFAARLIQPCRALRRWALGHEKEFGLLFGTPTIVDEKNAGDDETHRYMTTLWVRRLAYVWGPIFVELWATRGFPVIDEPDLDPTLAAQLDAYRTDTGVDMPLGAILSMLMCWRSIYGQVALEVFQHFAPSINDHGAMFELLMQELMSRLDLLADYRPPS